MKKRREEIGGERHREETIGNGDEEAVNRRSGRTRRCC